MNKAIEKVLLEAAEMDKEKIKVSHLQYADDTIFISPTKLGNVWAIRNILRNFAMLSGLQVNFNKSSIMGVNVESNVSKQMVGILGCEIISVPFSYLGIKVGANHKKAVE